MQTLTLQQFVDHLQQQITEGKLDPSFIVTAFDGDQNFSPIIIEGIHAIADIQDGLDKQVSIICFNTNQIVTGGVEEINIYEGNQLLVTMAEGMLQQAAQMLVKLNPEDSEHKVTSLEGIAAFSEAKTAAISHMALSVRNMKAMVDIVEGDKNLSKAEKYNPLAQYSSDQLDAELESRCYGGVPADHIKMQGSIDGEGKKLEEGDSSNLGEGVTGTTIPHPSATTVDEKSTEE